jgi:hypothetical protein
VQHFRGEICLDSKELISDFFYVNSNPFNRINTKRKMANLSFRRKYKVKAYTHVARVTFSTKSVYPTSHPTFYFTKMDLLSENFVRDWTFGKASSS